MATDQQTGAQAVQLVIDRVTASRLGIAPTTIDNTLYDAFGQRQINTLYTQLNQYHVILETDPRVAAGSREAGRSLHPVERFVGRHGRRRGHLVLFVGVGISRLECADGIGANTRRPRRCSLAPSVRVWLRAAQSREWRHLAPRRTPASSAGANAIPLSAFTQMHGHHRSALDQPPGPVPVRDGFVQPGAERVAGHRDQRH